VQSFAGETYKRLLTVLNKDPKIVVRVFKALKDNRLSTLDGMVPDEISARWFLWYNAQMFLGKKYSPRSRLFLVLRSSVDCKTILSNRYVLYRSIVVLVENAVSGLDLDRSKILTAANLAKAKKTFSDMEDNSRWNSMKTVLEERPLELVGLMPVLAKDIDEVCEIVWKQV